MLVGRGSTNGQLLKLFKISYLFTIDEKLIHSEHNSFPLLTETSKQSL